MNCRIVLRRAVGFLGVALMGALPGGFPAAHAAEPLAVANLKVHPDFKADLLYVVPKEKEGSWVAMCVDPKGRLLVSDQYGKLYRLTPPPLSSVEAPKIEAINLEIGSAQGLLYAFDSLYVMVNEERYQGRGLYRVRDTNRDDQFDEVKQLRKLEGGGEHGPHAILLSPDKKSLHVIIGNQTKPTQFDSYKVPPHWGEDILLPRQWDGNGFMKGVLGPGGWIAKTDPEGKSWELVASGFRNEYDAAFNQEGELFAYDADMEWDLNTPWYRPTRINHVISGAEFGWRSGASKYPAYYLDSFGSVVDIGPGSPTGVTFGYGAKFPAKYQQALFICDWSFGKMYAVHMEPSGSSYVGKAEEFITGQPLALTDIVVNPVDGAMYFAVGGRRTQGALYRVTYAGGESTAPSEGNKQLVRQRELRRQLESFHGRKDPAAVEAVWRHLGSKDRALRFAARIALEWQDTATWSERALKARRPRVAIAALAALSRASSRDLPHRRAGDPQPNLALQRSILEALDRIDWAKLATEDQLDLLRAYSLAFTRFSPPDDATRARLGAKFEPLFPSGVAELNNELATMLVYLETPAAASKLVAALKAAPTQEEQMHLAKTLRTLRVGWTTPLREEYFKWFLRAASFKGGSSLAGFLRDMRNDSIETLTEAEKVALKTLLDTKPQAVSPLQTITQRPLVKEWKLADIAPAVESSLKGGRSFEQGRAIFGQAGCAACHRYNGEGASVGPDLTTVSGRFSPRDLLESIIDPNKEISDQYGAIVIKKKDGDVVVGRVGNLNGDNLMVIENMFAPNDFTNVKRGDIETIHPSTTSMMPEGLLNYFSEAEIKDLVAYMLSQGNRSAAAFK